LFRPSLEPNIEFSEIETFIVPKKSFYAIKAEMDLDGKTEVDDTHITYVK